LIVTVPSPSKDYSILLSNYGAGLGRRFANADFTFSEDVNVVASNLKLIGLTTGNVPTIAEFNYDIPSMTATGSANQVVELASSR
jgi:hypothetical protein